MYFFPRDNQSPSRSPIITIDTSSSVIGTTAIPMNEPPTCLPSPFSGSENLRQANPSLCLRSLFLSFSDLLSRFLCYVVFQSLLINGRGKYNCSLLGSTADSEVCNLKNPACFPAVLTVIPGKTYRYRIASLTSLSSFSFQIEVLN